RPRHCGLRAHRSRTGPRTHIPRPDPTPGQGSRMSNFAVLLLKEERALFSSPIAWVVMTVFLVIMGYIFSVSLFLSHEPSLVHIFFQMFILFLLTTPIITMRLLAEERKLRTLEVLLTAPVSEIEIVLSKFVAGMTLVVLMVLLSGSYAV